MLARLQSLANHPLRVALLLGLTAQLLFTFHITFPAKLMFDEVHYVPAAQALLDMSTPRNAEHPLVGKELIAFGMLLFGDNPWGWRLIPSLFGSATVVGAFAFLWLLLGRVRPAVIGAFLLMLNQLLYMQARIAMLDVFLGAFILWALVVFLWAAQSPPGKVRARWILGSALLGLAVGVKWAAIPYVALAGLAFLVIRFRHRQYWPGLGTLPGLTLMGGASIAVYCLTFLPAFFFDRNAVTLAGFIPFQREMYALQTQVLAHHTYQSQWWSWPLMLRPIWYFYEFYQGAQRGVLFVGNPVIMWGGLIAVIACLMAWLNERAMRPLAVALLWIASLAIYIVIPKSLGFYYYYHLSGIFLCLTIAVAFHHFDRDKGRGLEEWFTAGSLLAFLYFYPIISAWPLSAGDSFSFWMWFPSWL